VIQQTLTRQWKDAGMHPADCVLLHSSISRTMRRARGVDSKFSVEGLLQSFLQAVGAEGTLLLPLFNFDFCSGAGFDIRTTPSTMGALTEVARNDSRFQRTKHPIYSFAVCGPLASSFVSLTNTSALADDGPFGLLRRVNGKIAVLDLDDQNSMTMYHHIEEVLGVSYRYHKRFDGEYVDALGNSTTKSFELFVWDEVQGIRTDVNRAGELLWQEGLYSGSRPGVDSGLRVIQARKMFDSIARVIDSGRARDYLYSIENVRDPNE
jgi:aminoglycoside 3-N-acetyltransferase